MMKVFLWGLCVDRGEAGWCQGWWWGECLHGWMDVIVLTREGNRDYWEGVAQPSVQDIDLVKLGSRVIFQVAPFRTPPHLLLYWRSLQSVAGLCLEELQCCDVAQALQRNQSWAGSQFHSV